MSEEQKQPCYPAIPDRGYDFVDASGYGFTWGLAGSSIFSSLGGLRRGGGLAGAARAVSANAPRAAGSMAAYFALYSALGTAMDVVRRKEDLWNSVAAGAVSWAAIGVRRGAPGAALVALEVADEFLDVGGRLETLRRERELAREPPIVVQEVPVGDQSL